MICHLVLIHKFNFVVFINSHFKFIDTGPIMSTGVDLKCCYESRWRRKERRGVGRVEIISINLIKIAGSFVDSLFRSNTAKFNLLLIKCNNFSCYTLWSYGNEMRRELIGRMVFGHCLWVLVDSRFTQYTLRRVVCLCGFLRVNNVAQTMCMSISNIDVAAVWYWWCLMASIFFPIAHVRITCARLNCTRK